MTEQPGNNFKLNPREEAIKADILKGGDAATGIACVMPIEEQIKFWKDIAHQSALDNETRRQKQILTKISAHEANPQSEPEAIANPSHYAEDYVSISVWVVDNNSWAQRSGFGQRQTVLDELIDLQTLRHEIPPAPYDNECTEK